MLAVRRNGYRGDSAGYAWPHSPSGVGLIRDPMGHRPFVAHGSGVDLHPGDDIVLAQGDPVYAPLSGAVIRVHYTFFGFETAAQLDRWTEVDPNSSLAVAHGGSFLALTAARVGDASFPSQIARYQPVLERINPHGTENWLLQIALTSAISVVGAIGIGIFAPDLAEYVAMEYDGATITRRGLGTTTFTANGATTSISGRTWLRITYTASTGEYAWLYSTNGTSWTTIGTETGRTFTSTQPTFAPTVYWRSGDTNATPYSIGVQRVEYYDLEQNTASRFGNHIMISNGLGKMVMDHLESLSVDQGQFVHAGQLIGRCGKTGFDSTSGAVLSPHVHLEWHPNPRYTYSNDEAANPLDVFILPRANVSNNVTVVLTRENDPEGNDSHLLTITTARADQDFDVNEISLTGNLATRTININTREGIDPADRDANNYQGVRFDPGAFDEFDDEQVLRYFFQTATVGTTVVSWFVGDTQGTVLDSG